MPSAAEELALLTATEAAPWLAEGRLRAAELAGACLQRLKSRSGALHAFVHVDPGRVHEQARKLDAWRQTGRPPGPLHGVAVGVEDVIDCIEAPTGNGIDDRPGRRPGRDAAVVVRLRAAGAVIFGKTSTSVLAHGRLSKARLPSDPVRPAGGPAGGSAAAVAAGIVPLAVAVQSADSVILAASRCGVFGYKPSHGMIPRTGTLLKSLVLDTVGVFGRSIEDIALLADTLAGHDGNDPGSPTQPPPRLTALAGEDPPLDPTFAFVSQAGWATADDETRQGFDELTGLLGERCDPLDLPDTFQETPAIHRTLLLAGLAGHSGRHCAGLRDTGVLTDFEAGQAIPAVRYLAALDWREVLHAAHERLFDRYDAILTPAAAGEAKPGETETASSAFCTPWTLLGVPAVSLPLMEGPDGMPVGVQLVGRRGYDGRLLRTARWLVRFLAEGG